MEVEGPLFNLKVLLLEDELFVAMATEQILTDLGAQRVTCCATIREAYDRLSAEAYDVAVLDLKLPDGDSLDAARELLSSGCAVVFHSGHADENCASTVPGSVYCPKPSGKNEILSAIQRAQELSSS